MFTLSKATFVASIYEYDMAEGKGSENSTPSHSYNGFEFPIQ